MISISDLWLTVARVARSLRRSPGFVAIAALSLGTALGLSTALFGVIDAMRHPISGIRDVEQVWTVQLWSRSRKPGPDADQLQTALRQLPVVADVASYRWDWGLDVEIADRVDRHLVAFPRDGFWKLLDIRPRLGRLPTAAEANSGSVTVVSDSLWRSEYGDLRSIGPAKLSIGGRQYNIVGVLPRNSAVPTQADIWIPDPASNPRAIDIVRLKSGVREAELAANLTALAKLMSATYLTPTDAPFSTVVQHAGPDPLALKDIHRAMIGAAICLLLIACANVAALMLARGTAKTRDYALALALGASPRTVFLEVIVEVVVLSVIGSIVGAIVAAWTLDLIGGVTPEEMGWLGFAQPQWSLRVLAQSAVAVFASVAVAGGFPAWRASRLDPAGPLKDGSGGHTGRGSSRFRLLVMAELAIAMTLIVGTSLMVKSVSKMEHYDFGYDARHLVQANFWLFYRDTTSEEAKRQLRTVWIERVRELPGVQSVARIDRCHAEKRIVISDRTAEGGPSLYVDGCLNLSAGFFRTLGVPLLEGRDFSDADADVGGAAILDVKTSRRLFRHDSPIGHAIKLGDARSNLPWLRIVGVVRDKRLDFDPYPEMGPDSSSTVYVSQPVVRADMGTLVIRPRPGAANVGASVRNMLRDLLPPRSNVRIRSWTDDYDTSLRVEQLLSAIFALLGVTSLVLGAAGIFSVVSYIAGQRNREFAVRIALGARGGSILRVVMRDALVMALGGTAIGAGLGMWAGFLLWDKMWGVYPVDAGALVIAESTLVAVTLLACLVPALRAMRADPLEIIRAN